MRSIEFPISSKKNEKRRAIVPADIDRLSSPESIYIEIGYGKDLGL